FARRGPREEIRLVRDGDRVLAGLTLIPMGQFWGGRSVSHMGIGGVVVYPEARGAGVGKHVMRAAVDESARRGFAMAGLFPATWPVYRSAGFEVAGGRWKARLRTREIQTERRDESVPSVRLMSSGEKALVKRAYARWAPRAPGHMARTDYIWEHKVFRFHKATQRVYLIEGEEGGDGVDGYVALRTEWSDELKGTIAIVSDMVALTPRAARGLWAFLQGHWSIVAGMEWNCGPTHPMLGALRDRTFEMSLVEHWMVRLVDVKASLEARGYSPGVAGRVTVEVYGDWIESNNGVWSIEVRDGGATLASVSGPGEVRAHVRALASVFAGYATPAHALLDGLVEGDDAAIARLCAMFAGPTPWMSEIY
ncbi:MAG: GNAT family N-acetyltransferase, partial [Planctomycetota bacterium]